MTEQSFVILAGSTGDLGYRIAKALIEQNVQVHALVRPSSSQEQINRLQKLNHITIVKVDYTDHAALVEACKGAVCVVSALSGLREVIVDTQTLLLHAAVEAAVPRFIPSDFSIDYRDLPPGSNRNLDLRREFRHRLDQAPIAATSILNGAFADMLTGTAPIILFRFKRILYWEYPDQLMDFTTKDDVASYTARAAVDSTSPRFLRIAGDQISARQLGVVMTELTRQPYRLMRAGSMKRLDSLIKITRKVAPQEQEIYPAWQGMQYLGNMFRGQGKLHTLDNDRYRGIVWTQARSVLAKNQNDN